MTTTMMKMNEETSFDELFALGSQYLSTEDFSTGMFPVPTSYDHVHQQQRCLSTADKKRQERNAREKERSFRITKQIEELKELLISSGIKVRNECLSVLLLFQNVDLIPLPPSGFFSCR